MSKKILAIGSVAFDVIFSIPDDFRKSIPLENGEIRNFNATYVAGSKSEFPGGTAGNIAFWAGSSGASISIFTAFGKDFTQLGYAQKLQAVNVDVRGTEGEFSAHAYMVSDPLHQQLVIWQPNAYGENESQNLSDFYTDEALAKFEFVIFSPGTPSSIKKHMTEFRTKNKKAQIILDPGQISPFFEANEFKEVVAMSDILIGNDIEFKHFDRYFDGRENFPKTLRTIETLGERGVNVDGRNYPAQKVEKVVETTGAGDAFRGGFIAKLLETGNWDEAIIYGTKLGAQCVALPSGQY